MSGESKSYIKVYCRKSDCFGLLTVEVINGIPQITNFYGIDRDTAKKVVTRHEGALPVVSASLIGCNNCGRRVAGCCNKSGQCRVKKGTLEHQCLYCSAMEVCSVAGNGGADIYFLMDESGSMSRQDRVEGANAVRRMIQSLQGEGNTYTFVAWASRAGYLFRQETSLSKMSSALVAYENDSTGYTGSTNAAGALDLIRDAVLTSRRPVRILLVTDGAFDNENAAIRKRNEILAKKNVEILAIGVTGAIQRTLQRMGTVPEFSRVVGGSSALTSTFEQIAEILKKNGNNF